MGTSSIYEGQKDKNGLLPSDFEEITNEEKKENEMPWKNTKTLMSKYITGHSKNLSGVIKNYVRASGGASNLVKTSKSGVKSTVALGNFLDSIRQKGLNKTLNEFNIEFQGRDIEEVLSDIVNIIAKDSNTKENIVAKNATNNALEKIYEFIKENNLDFNSLEIMNDDMFEVIMCRYISEYIWEKMLNDLESRFEKYLDDAKKTLEIENDFKEYIENKVEATYKSKNIKSTQFSNKDTEKFVKEIYKDCYEVLGGELK